MEIKLDRKILNNVLQLAGSVVPTKSIKPIFQCVKIEAKEPDILEVQGTDLEVGIKCVIGKVKIEKGAIVVPASKINGILREAKEEEVHIVSEGSFCNIYFKDGIFKVVCDDVEQFPDIADFDEKDCIKINAQDIKEMVRKTAFAAGNEKVRYALNGIYFTVKGKRARMVATDGRRLSFIEKKMKVSSEREEGVIVPTKTMMLLDRIITDQNDMVNIQISKNEILFKIGGIIVKSRLVEGHFPEYENVIPAGCPINVKVNKDNFISAIRRASILSMEDSRFVILHIKENSMEISANSPTYGEAKVNIAVEKTGGDIEMGFNPDYLLDVLKVIDGEEAELEFAGENKAAKIVEGKEFSYTVMPVER